MSKFENVVVVDIFVAAMPTVDFNDANSRSAWKVTPSRVGAFLRRVERHQRGHTMFVVVEMTAIENGSTVPMSAKDTDHARELLNLSWHFDFDAKFMSGVSRACTIFTNFPVAPSSLSVQNVASLNAETFSATCLEGKYEHGGAGLGSATLLRFPSFLPDKASMDNEHTMVFHRGSSQQRPTNARERASLMGYPADYVDTPSTSSDMCCAHCVRLCFHWHSHRKVQFRTFSINCSRADMGILC
jgi:hypothetical protein